MPLEITIVIAIAVFPFPEALSVGLPLAIAATLSRWVRGRTWGELMTGGRERVAIGALVGVAALVIAAVLFRRFDVAAVDWWLAPAARADVGRLAMALATVGAIAAAMELAMRGWIVERMLELSPGPAVLPIVTGGLAEAIVTPGPPTARIGAALFGIGLGALYVAGGRSLVAPVLARVTFAVGAVVVEALSA